MLLAVSLYGWHRTTRFKSCARNQVYWMGFPALGHHRALLSALYQRRNLGQREETGKFLMFSTNIECHPGISQGYLESKIVSVLPTEFGVYFLFPFVLDCTAAGKIKKWWKVFLDFSVRAYLEAPENEDSFLGSFQNWLKKSRLHSLPLKSQGKEASLELGWEAGLNPKWTTSSI